MRKKVPLFDIRRGLCGPFPLFVNVGGHGSVVCGPCEKKVPPMHDRPRAVRDPTLTKRGEG